MTTQQLSGTTAILTGASRGFGRGIATALANVGAHVVGVARDAAALEEVHEQLGSMSRPVAAGPGTGYGTLVAPLIIAGIGGALCFPTAANQVTGSVPAADIGVAAGTNNALNALGGVFGIAIMAAIFAAYGSYHTPRHVHRRVPASRMGRRRSLRPRRDSSRARPRQASNRRPHYSRARTRSRQAARMTTDTKPAGSGTPMPSPPTS